VGREFEGLGEYELNKGGHFSSTSTGERADRSSKAEECLVPLVTLHIIGFEDSSIRKLIAQAASCEREKKWEGWSS